MRYIATILSTAVAVLAVGSGSTAGVVRVVDGRQPHRTIVVHTTIQAAVDAARPGDTVVVPAGTYREAVTVQTAGLTIQGGPNAILDGDGLSARAGIRVRSADGGRLAGFTLRGLTIRDFAFSGVLVDGVDDFRLTGTSYVDNEEYGLFPVRSSGLVDHNTVSGSDDAGVYVGQSSHVQVDANIAHDNTVGIEIELSTSVGVTNNLATGNTIGVIVQILPGLPATTTFDIQVSGNILAANTRPNDVTDPTEPLSVVPSGIGLLDVAGDQVTITKNVVSGNPTAGIAVVSLPALFAGLDPRLDPTPDRTVVSANLFWHNGFAPDPRAAPLQPADIVWDGTGTANCFSANGGATTFPAKLPPC
jgi:parallel beta-helix repeat protein